MNKRIRKKHLSLQDREAQRKGLALVRRIERLVQTDKGFRDWIQEGIDQIEAGNCVILTEKDLLK